MSVNFITSIIDPKTVQLEKKKKVIIALFWYENPIFHQILQHSNHLEQAREKIFNYLVDFEKKSFQHHLHHQLDYNLAFKAIKILKNIFCKRNEELTDFSSLAVFFQHAHGNDSVANMAFWEEFRHLFLAMKCKTEIFKQSHKNTEAGYHLSNISRLAREEISKYPSGLQPGIIRQREFNRIRIQKILAVSDQDWNTWQWQCRNVIKDSTTLRKLIELSPMEKKALEQVEALGIPFGITPYYASLMDYTGLARWDRPVRMQVIPPLSYVEEVALTKKDPSLNLDFMGEKWTSPINLVTRRYPMIAIFKPFNTCAQICVYCQRNWEIKDVLDQHALASKNERQKALEWFAQHPEINEILITGGDPAVMSDEILKDCLEIASSLKHITRIRIGTRIPVVMPMRVTEAWADLLASYHQPGIREVALMTHFQHSIEITPESMQAVQRLRRRGISVYNQAVFTSQNCRRFEMVALRKALRLIGVEPYYTFNAKGKKESIAYRVPIARLLQEQAEEARPTPGLDRTDEAVFNIPRLGKNYLRNGNDHEVIMVMADGSRLYQFFPWDHQSPDIEPYLHEDPPIYDFLNNLEAQGAGPEAYKTIWYYY